VSWLGRQNDEETARYREAHGGELRAMRKHDNKKSKWRAAARKPLPSGRNPDDPMEPIDRLTTELPASQRKSRSDPFGTFTEWSSETDEKAYGDL
jgi:hypothetical protein